MIRPHSTTIMHSDQMNNIHAPSIIRHADSRVESLSEGQLAVPVQINRGSMVNDATMSNYETPLFLSKGPKKLNIPMRDFVMLRKAEAEDAGRLRKKLLAAKSQKARIRARKLSSYPNHFLVKFEKEKLREEAKKLGKSLAAEMENLLKSKSISNKLDNLLKKYSLKVKQDQLAKSKVVDREQIKKELKQKILREVQGLRSFSNKESLLSKVDQKDLNKIINRIKNKLGH